MDKTLVPSPKPKNPVFDNEEKSKVKKHITVLELRERFQVQYNLGSIDPYLLYNIDYQKVFFI